MNHTQVSNSRYPFHLGQQYADCLMNLGLQEIVIVARSFNMWDEGQALKRGVGQFLRVCRAKVCSFLRSLRF